MSAEGFDTGWLNERFAYDNAARNTEVEQAFINHFRFKEKLSILDIGAGTGANCLYFMERLFKNQEWTLIEKDPQLCEACKQRIERFLLDYNFFYTYEDNVFRIKIWESRVKIKIINASFFDLKELVDLDQIDVLMAAAVFDVLTLEQFEEVMKPIVASKTALFTSMNYHSMKCLPEESLDIEFVSAYENHMMREQTIGVAMGPKCSSLIEAFFKQHQIEFIKGSSQWKLDERAQKMHSFLLNFMEGALGEEALVDLKIFNSWLSEKRALSQSGRLNMEVNHLDYFVIL